MKEDKLQDAIGMVDDDLVKEADIKPKSKVLWYHVAAVAATIVILLSVGISLFKGGSDGNNGGDENSGNTSGTTQFVEQNSSEKESSSERESSSEVDETQMAENETTGLIGKEEETLGQETNDTELLSYAIAQAEYPKTAIYPYLTGSYNSDLEDVWFDERAERRKLYRESSVDVNEFIKESFSEFLSDSNGSNKVYSPLNIYIALGMLAEITDTETREEILAALGCDTIEELRENANILWRTHYINDEAHASVLASSIWLNKKVDFNEDTLKNLATNYYASSYEGKMGSEEFNSALRNWLDEQTGGLLSDQIREISMNSDSVMTLATTIYYSSKWSSEFYESGTKKATFHGSDGDIKCDFMSQSGNQIYYWGKNFSSVRQYMEIGGSMYFILPDEGVSVDDLVKDEEVIEYILSGYEWENQKLMIVNMEVPKFDVNSELDLKEELRKLGINMLFENPDFSPLCDISEDVELSSAKHNARVMIDEEGCKAAAYTVIATDGACPPSGDEIDFIVDRPFIFVITSDVGLPLFIGIVNNI